MCPREGARADVHDVRLVCVCASRAENRMHAEKKERKKANNNNNNNNNNKKKKTQEKTVHNMREPQPWKHNVLSE